MGTCNNSSVAWLVESRTQMPKCVAHSNRQVDNGLGNLATVRKKHNRVAAV